VFPRWSKVDDAPFEKKVDDAFSLENFGSISPQVGYVRSILQNEINT
jgi:hypothetical protein